MAEIRKIVIEINQSTTSEEKTPNVVKDSGDVNVDLNALLHPIKTVEQLTVGKNVLVNQAYQVAKQLVNQVVDTSLNRYASLSEDYLFESTLNNVKNGISKVTGFATSVIGGAITGSVFGPVGSAIGGVIGAIGYGVGEVVSGINTKNSYYASINATTYQTDFMRKRAGLTDNNQGTEN